MKLFLLLFLAGCAVKCDDSNYYVIQMPEDDSPIPTDFKSPHLQVYWNVPTKQCTSKKIPFKDLDRFGIIQNKNDSFRGEKIAILYDPGYFPALLRNETSGEIRFRNGGVPQEGDLELHLKVFRNVLEQSIPDENFSGFGIIDFESWRPILRQNFGDVVPYKSVSYEIERNRHWWWPQTWINAEAKQRFEEAAKLFMQNTISVAKQMRPHAKWGYYGFPYCFNMAGSTMMEDCSSNVQAENDQIDWLWTESTALFPSVYSSKNLSSSQLSQMIRGRVREAARDRRRDTPVLPYFWFRYRDGDFMNEVDLDTALNTFNQSEASGFIIWGSSNDVNTVDKCKKLLNYMEKVMGPAIAKYAKEGTRQDDEILNDANAYITHDEFGEENDTDITTQEQAEDHLSVTTYEPVLNATLDRITSLMIDEMDYQQNETEPILTYTDDETIERKNNTSQATENNRIKPAEANTGHNELIDLLLSTFVNSIDYTDIDNLSETTETVATTANTINYLKSNFYVDRNFGKYSKKYSPKYTNNNTKTLKDEETKNITVLTDANVETVLSYSGKNAINGNQKEIKTSTLKTTEAVLKDKTDNQIETSTYKEYELPPLELNQKDQNRKPIIKEATTTETVLAVTDMFELETSSYSFQHIPKQQPSKDSMNGKPRQETDIKDTENKHLNTSETNVFTDKIRFETSTHSDYDLNLNKEIDEFEQIAAEFSNMETEPPINISNSSKKFENLSLLKINVTDGKVKSKNLTTDDTPQDIFEDTTSQNIEIETSTGLLLKFNEKRSSLDEGAFSTTKPSEKENNGFNEITETVELRTSTEKYSKIATKETFSTERLQEINAKLFKEELGTTKPSIEENNGFNITTEKTELTTSTQYYGESTTEEKPKYFKHNSILNIGNLNSTDFNETDLSIVGINSDKAETISKETNKSITGNSETSTENNYKKEVITNVNDPSETKYVEFSRISNTEVMLERTNQDGLDEKLPLDPFDIQVLAHAV